ncbi:MAG: preprotein translocase subunit SecA [Candidatus Omnitrophica bacterium]|nr:preprotein translocase subunit SecA [Candidatus Omnitrophota bacterium]
MLDMIIRKPTINAARAFIKKLKPPVNIHIHQDSPLPSVSEVRRFAPVVARICALEEKMASLTDEGLKAKTPEFRQRIDKMTAPEMAAIEQAREMYRQAPNIDERQKFKDELKAAEQAHFKAKQHALNEILPEAFAVVREAGKRVLGMRHYDVQMIGGMTLHYGNIAEMTTGEGKTLVATLPAYLNALTGDGVHVVTVNDYLAKRDREWMGPLYEFLGLTVGVIQHDMSPQERQKSYGSDITYGTNNEFGFDYLRDNMVMFKDEMVQRPHHYAIVDEVDSILVDEARTPLIISGPAEESTDKYYRAYQISLDLKGRRVTEAEEVDAKHRGEDLGVGFDYVADEKHKSVSLTDAGEQKAAERFGVANLHDMETVEYRHHVLQSLRAKEFYFLDTEYVVKDGKVVIVDEFTGRMMPGRRWSDGLHQAVEAKEGIKIERENQTLATITFQNYFRMYKKLSGMTGTAYTEANEFKQIYKLDVIIIPTNRPLQRKNYPDCIFRTGKEKYEAVVKEIEACHEKGQPVLVGTVSIERSEYISSLLKARGVKHQVLNAKYHELEASIVSQAGRFKGVTIATNMAGRGTDIMLGGNAEFMARALAAQKFEEASKKNEATLGHEELTAQFIRQFRDQVKLEHDKVVEAGGLHIIGTERHESRRIDNQLRGRSGRQGDPGSSRFYVSLDDDLMRLFAGDSIRSLMDRFGFAEGEMIESSMVTHALEVAQRRVENYNFEIRKQLLEYDTTMNRQREVIYNMRRSIIDGDDTRELILESVQTTVDEAVRRYFATESGKERDIDGLITYVGSRFGLDITGWRERLLETKPEECAQMISEELVKLYTDKELKVGAQHIRHLERMFLLHTIDTKWKEHLYAMDRLKEGVGLRALGQRDPLVEFKREGYHMFRAMFESIHIDVAELIFKLQPVENEGRVQRVFTSQQEAVHQEFGGLGGVLRAAPSAEEAPMTQARPLQAHQPSEGQKKVGRNDDCPCGSGKKYKKCCGK